MTERDDGVREGVDPIANSVAISSAILLVLALQVVHQHVSVVLENVVTYQPHSIAGATLQVFVDPVDKVVVRLEGVDVVDDFAAFQQLSVFPRDSVDPGGLVADPVLRVDEPLEDGDLFVDRNRGDVNDLRLLVDVGRRHLEVNVVNSRVVVGLKTKLMKITNIFFEINIWVLLWQLANLLSSMFS